MKDRNLNTLRNTFNQSAIDYYSHVIPPHLLGIGAGSMSAVSRGLPGGIGVRGVRGIACRLPRRVKVPCGRQNDSRAT